jgi:hypothetical protein
VPCRRRNFSFTISSYNYLGVQSFHSDTESLQHRSCSLESGYLEAPFQQHLNCEYEYESNAITNAHSMLKDEIAHTDVDESILLMSPAPSMALAV